MRSRPTKRVVIVSPPIDLTQIRWSRARTCRASAAALRRCLLVIEQAIALLRARPGGKATPMIALDIFAAALVIAMLGAMLNEDTRDSRIRIARL